MPLHPDLLPLDTAIAARTGSAIVPRFTIGLDCSNYLTLMPACHCTRSYSFRPLPRRPWNAIAPGLKQLIITWGFFYTHLGGVSRLNIRPSDQPLGVGGRNYYYNTYLYYNYYLISLISN